MMKLLARLRAKGLRRPQPLASQSKQLSGKQKTRPLGRMAFCVSASELRRIRERRYRLQGRGVAPKAGDRPGQNRSARADAKTTSSSSLLFWLSSSSP
jgi:hypothetical protein